jgi:FMN phosphatase YigB (HAD superfamily)
MAAARALLIPTAMLDGLVRLVERFDVLSLDVFDTAILREVARPLDVFAFVERHHAHGGGGATDFAAARRLAELEARRRAPHDHEDVTLEEIYDALPARLRVMREALQSLECRVEQRLTRANPFVRALADAATRIGRRVVFVADTSLPRATIAALLEAAGYGAPSELFVSSVHRCTKGSGRLYSEVATRLGVAPGRILHVGGHPLADVLMPLRRGWGALLYERCAARARFGRAPEDLGESVYQGLVQRRLHAWRGSAGTFCSWYALGYRVIGPLVTAFGDRRFDVTAGRRATRLIRRWRDGSGHEANELRAGASAMAADFERVRVDFPWLTLAPEAALRPLAPL